MNLIYMLLCLASIVLAGIIDKERELEFDGQDL